MFKHLSIVFLVSCVTLPTFAYTIGQQLTVVNNSNKDMQIYIARVNRQAPVSQFIKAHDKITIYTENGDNSGLLNQLSVAPFTIRHAFGDIEYATGNINFYVGSWYRYSYLSAVKAKEGASIQTKYSCEGGNRGVVFQNTIILDGHPSGMEAAAAWQGTYDGSCVGLKSSALNKTYTNYVAACSDGITKQFFYRDSCSLTGVDKNGQTIEAVCSWVNNTKITKVILKGTAAAEVTSTVPNNKISFKTLKFLKELMDKTAGDPSCSGFSV